MSHRTLAKKRAGALAGQVNELVGQHQVQRFELFAQRAHGGYRQQVAHAKLLHGVNVGAVRHFRRQQAVAARMPGQKYDALAMHLASDQHIRRCAEGGADQVFPRVLQRVHFVETAAAENTDQCLGHGVGAFVGERNGVKVLGAVCSVLTETLHRLF